MKALRIKNIVDFPFMTSPKEETLIRSLELLYTLMAIDINGELTKDIGENYVNCL
jgi:HrpA-like RNA helicase